MVPRRGCEVESIEFGGFGNCDWMAANRRVNKMKGTWLIGDVLKDLSLTSNGEIFGREDHALRGDDDGERSLRIRVSSAGGSSFLSSMHEALQV